MCLYEQYNVILIEFWMWKKTHTTKTTNYHMINAIIHFPTTGMYTFSKIYMNLIQQRGHRRPFFGCLAHRLINCKGILCIFYYNTALKSYSKSVLSKSCTTMYNKITGIVYACISDDD